MEQPNVCAICLSGYEQNEQNEQNEQDIHVLPCNHSFHCECIIKWFRSSTGKCPLCNDNPYSDSVLNENNINFHFSQGYVDERYDLLQKLSTKTKAPSKLKKEMIKMKSMNKDYKFFCKELKQYEKTEEVKLINKNLRKYRKDNWKFKRNIVKQKHKIVAMYPTLYLL